MYKNVDEMSDEELCYCLAKAGAAECYIYGESYNGESYNGESYNSSRDSITNVFQEGTHKLYRPTQVATQFCTLLDKYKPYISYTDTHVVVEVMSGHHINLYNTKLNYATAKNHNNNVKKALCEAIVALHYGYEFDLEELRDEGR